MWLIAVTHLDTATLCPIILKETQREDQQLRKVEFAVEE
jgi:hypothetical protein